MFGGMDMLRGVEWERGGIVVIRPEGDESIAWCEYSWFPKDGYTVLHCALYTKSTKSISWSGIKDGRQRLREGLPRMCASPPPCPSPQKGTKASSLKAIITSRFAALPLCSSLSFFQRRTLFKTGVFDITIRLHFYLPTYHPSVVQAVINIKNTKK
jgi:hypothetical protein